MFQYKYDSQSMSIIIFLRLVPTFGSEQDSNKHANTWMGGGVWRDSCWFVCCEVSLKARWLSRLELEIELARSCSYTRYVSEDTFSLYSILVAFPKCVEVTQCPFMCITALLITEASFGL
jgi:hypothetical protein